MSQALTAVWKKELKDVLDDRLFRHMNIEPDDWQWSPGQELHDDRAWYPGMPGYGLSAIHRTRSMIAACKEAAGGWP